MWKAWRKRAVAYLVLITAVVGVIFMLKTTALEVDLVVDLVGVRTRDGLKLMEARITILELDGQWVGASVHTFPPALFPHGPPAETTPVNMQLGQGEYEARMEFVYGDGPSSPRETRRLQFTVEQAGPIRLRAKGG